MSVADLDRATCPGALVYRLDDGDAAAAFGAIAQRLTALPNRSHEVVDEPSMATDVRNDGR